MTNVAARCEAGRIFLRSFGEKFPKHQLKKIAPQILLKKIKNNYLNNSISKKIKKNISRKQYINSTNNFEYLYNNNITKF